jgi:hypothetical protein
MRQADPERRVNFVIAEGLAATGDPAMMRVVLEDPIQNAWKFTSLRDVARIKFDV